jgi:iron complex outermembrane recepter protein
MRLALLVLALSALLRPAAAQNPLESPRQPEDDRSATPQPAHHETVVVTGTPQPVPLEEADRSVTVYEIPDRVLLFGSISQALGLDSSVALGERAPNGVQGDISIRGGSFGQTLVLVNGIRVNDAQSAHHNFDIPVPLDAVQQIEILRGSGSTLYGSDAVGGVVNVITRVDNPSELRIRAGIGNFGTNEQSGLFSFNWGRLSQQFSFQRELSTGFQNDRDYRNLSASSETRVRTALGATDIYFAGLDRPFGADQFYGNYNSWERTKTWFSSIRQEIGSNTDFSLAYRRHTDLFVLLRSAPQIYTNRHEDESWDAALRRNNQIASAARLFYGAEAFSDRVESNNLGDHHRKRGALYADFDIRALRRFSLSLGAREEFFGKQHGVFLPSVAGGFWLTPQLKIRAAASRAFRLPNYTDLYYSDPANQGNPLLQPEKAMNYEAGLDWHLSSRWRASATVFHRREQNDIDYVRNSSADIWRATNFQRLRFTGFELLMDTRLAHSQDISVAYTALRGAQAELGTMQSKYVFNYPTHEAIASWQVLAANGILARTRVGVTDRYRRAPYALWDASVAWTKPRIRPYLRMTNLTSTRYEEVPGVGMPGRAVLVGLEACVICAKR